MKTSSLFDDENDKLNEIETKDEEDEMTLLSKKLQRILRGKRNEKKIKKKKRKALLQKKNLNKKRSRRIFQHL